jgi:hypothetical protein
VVLADDARHWRPHTFHYELFETTLNFSFSAVKLLDYANQCDALQTSHHPFALITRLLTRRFGPLSKTVKSKLSKASLAQLAACSDALPDAETLKQVFQS